MALVLGMQLESDNEIYLNDLRVTIDKLIGKNQAHITVHGICLDEGKVINNEQYTNITSNVKMMLGLPEDVPNFCKVLVDAPRNVKILRGKLKAKT